MINRDMIFLLLLSAGVIYFIIKRLMLPFIRRVSELYDIKRNGNSVEAEIINYRTDKDASGVAFYIQIVEYNIDNSKVRSEIEYPVKEKPNIGEKILIYYSQSNRDKVVADVDKAIEKNFIGIVFLSLIISLIIGFCVMKLI